MPRLGEIITPGPLFRVMGNVGSRIYRATFCLPCLSHFILSEPLQKVGEKRGRREERGTQSFSLLLSLRHPPEIASQELGVRGFLLGWGCLLQMEESFYFLCVPSAASPRERVLPTKQRDPFLVEEQLDLVN